MLQMKAPEVRRLLAGMSVIMFAILVMLTPGDASAVALLIGAVGLLVSLSGTSPQSPGW